jgi:hypothetical protein
MKLVGDNRKLVYAWFSHIYEQAVGSSFDFQSGEKERVRKIFTYISEAMGIRDTERFDEVKECYKEYLEQKTDEWLEWDKCSRNNYIGFLLKPEEISIFVTSYQKKDENQVGIAGTESQDEWGY